MGNPEVLGHPSCGVHFSSIRTWRGVPNVMHDGHPMYRELTHRVRRPGRWTAVVLAVFMALGAAAQAAPSPEPSPSAEDAKLNGIFAKFDAKRDAVEGRLRALELDLIDDPATAEQGPHQAQEGRGRAGPAPGSAGCGNGGARGAEAPDARQRGLPLHARAVELRQRHAQRAKRKRHGRVEVFSESVLNDFISVMHDLSAKKEAATKAYGAARARAIDAPEAGQGDREGRDGAARGSAGRVQPPAAAHQRAHRRLRRARRAAQARLRHHRPRVRRNGHQDRDDAPRGAEGSRGRGGRRVLPSLAGRVARASRRPYGWRIHPLWGYRSLHTGIDVGANYGDEIVSSLAGSRRRRSTTWARTGWRR